MNKKQFLSAALASLISINTLTGCTSKNITNVTSSEKSDTSITEYQDDSQERTITETEKEEIKQKVKEILGDLKSKITDTYKVTEFENYRITKINNSHPFINLLPGLIEKDEANYQVVKVVNTSYTYQAAKSTLEDGTIVYYCPFGGTLSGHTAVVNKTSYELVPTEEALEVISRYLEKDNSLKLEK